MNYMLLLSSLQEEMTSGSSSIFLHMASTVCGNNKTEGALGLHEVTLTLYILGLIIHYKRKSTQKRCAWIFHSVNSTTVSKTLYLHRNQINKAGILFSLWIPNSFLKIKSHVSLILGLHWNCLGFLHLQRGCCRSGSRTAKTLCKQTNTFAPEIRLRMLDLSDAKA